LSLWLTTFSTRPWRRMGEWMHRSTFLDLGISWRWVVRFTQRPLYPQGKSPRYRLDRRLGGPQSRSGRCGEEKILDPAGTRTPTPWVIQPVASRYTESTRNNNKIDTQLRRLPVFSSLVSWWGCYLPEIHFFWPCSTNLELPVGTLPPAYLGLSAQAVSSTLYRAKGRRPRRRWKVDFEAGTWITLPNPWTQGEGESPSPEVRSLHLICTTFPELALLRLQVVHVIWQILFRLSIFNTDYKGRAPISVS
jgi:hypothetical protein